MLYTRQEYIHGAPQPRITKFTMGRYAEDYTVEILLKAKQRVLIRDRALESLRINVNRQLQKRVGGNNYYFIINVYPHHVLRENKMMTGAGADRLQEGMRRAFGKPVGRAAKVEPGQVVLRVLSYKNFTETIKQILASVKSKIPKGGYIEVKELR